MSRDMRYFDLLEACAQPGCPVCRLALQAGQRYLDSVLYEGVNDPGVREGLRQARGYCREHAWQLTNQTGHALGVAILQRDVVETTLEQTATTPLGRHARQRARRLLQRLQPTADCPACAYRRTTEDDVLRALLQYSDDEALAAALRDSAGLCLPHFRRALELVPDAGALHRLVDGQRRALARLRDELNEFIRKNDYRFRDEGFGPEGDSWQRAIGIVSGERGER